MTRKIAPFTATLPALLGALLLGGTLIFLPACSKGGRSSGAGGAAQTGSLIPVSGAHVAIYLRDYDGKPIDVTSGTEPYSPRQTCGYCHNYDLIAEGYHFQQGADFLDDDYGTNHGTYDWVTSPGMTGKW